MAKNITTSIAFEEMSKTDLLAMCRDFGLQVSPRAKKEEIIKMHIRACDYRAALQVADTLPSHTTEKYIDLIRMAAARLQFDLNTVSKLEVKTGFHCLPIRSVDAVRRFEYALNLQVKLEKREYADFIRAITPLIVDLFEQVLKEKCAFNVDDYCSPAGKQKKESRKWNISSFKKDAIGIQALNALNKKYKSNDGFKGKDVSSDHLKTLIQLFSSDQTINEVVAELRNVESNVRNIAAHQLVSIDEQKILDLTGQSAKSIMKDIKTLFVYAGYKIPKGAWNSYKEMNDFIIDMIQER